MLEEIEEHIQKAFPTFTLPASRGWSSGSSRGVNDGTVWSNDLIGSAPGSAYTMTVSNAAPASVMNAADILGG